MSKWKQMVEDSARRRGSRKFGPRPVLAAPVPLVGAVGGAMNLSLQPPMPMVFDAPRRGGKAYKDIDVPKVSRVYLGGVRRGLRQSYLLSGAWLGSACWIVMRLRRRWCLGRFGALILQASVAIQ